MKRLRSANVFATVACADCGTEWRPRDEIGGYTLREMLARGGFSQIFHALDPTSGDSIAVKILCPPTGCTRRDADRFLSNAHFLATHDHPHWLRVFGGGVEDEIPWLAMEWMPAGSLAACGKVGEIEAVNAAAQIAEALAAAHANGLEHHNLEIGECFLDDRGAVKVAGFAEAIFYETAGREVGTVWGRLSCAPPERVFDEAEDARSEIYALGVILFQMLTGELPFEGETVPEHFVARLDDRAAQCGDQMRDVQKTTVAIVERILAVDPAQRFSSWEEMAEILRHQIELLNGKGSAAAPRAEVVSVARPVAKPPKYSAAGGAWFTILMLAGIAAFLGWYGWKHFRGATVESALETPAAIAQPEPPSPPPPPTLPPTPALASMDWSVWKVNLLESPKRPGVGKGESSFSGSALRITGNNTGMAGTNDECVFYAREIAGDWEFTARIGVTTGPAGIVAREGIGSDRPCVAVFFGADGKLMSALRTQPAERLAPAPVAIGAGSRWLRLVRSGTTISAFHSADGKIWREAATLNLPGLPASVPVGFTVWSGVTAKPASAIFEDIALTVGN